MYRIGNISGLATHSGLLFYLSVFPFSISPIVAYFCPSVCQAWYRNIDWDKAHLKPYTLTLHSEWPFLHVEKNENCYKTKNKIVILYNNLVKPLCIILNYKRLCPSVCVCVCVSCPLIISDLNTPSQCSDSELYI